MKIPFLMRKAAIFFAAALIFSALTSCGARFTETTVFAMDTFITFKLPAGYSASGAEALAGEIEKRLSRADPESEISRFNSSESGTELSEQTAALIKKALSVAAAAKGLFDPTVGPLTELWNIDHGEPLLPSEADIEAALTEVGYKKLTLEGNALKKSEPGVKLDLGAIGKGYACQETVELLKAEGVPYGIVSYGGNVGMFGTKPDGSSWVISVRDPDVTDGAVGYLRLDGGYVSVSGDYERYFIVDGVRYHHILDPRTGWPARSGLRSVAVISGDGAEGDALSTALFVMGYDKAMEFYRGGAYKFEAVFVTGEGVFITDGLKSNDIFKYEDN